MEPRKKSNLHKESTICDGGAVCTFLAQLKTSLGMLINVPPKGYLTLEEPTL